MFCSASRMVAPLAPSSCNTLLIVATTIGADQEIVLDAVLGKHLPVLGHIGEAEPGTRMRRRAGDVAVGEKDATAFGGEDSRQRLHGRALARAVTPEQRQRAFFLKREIDIEQYLAGAIEGAHAFGPQEIRHVASASVPR
jgi:hypothetical protein